MSSDGSNDTADHGDGHQEYDLAGYLVDELAPAEHDKVDRHLLGCESCWQEVQLARAGRAAAMAAAEPAPDELRRRLAVAFADARTQPGASIPAVRVARRRPFGVSLLAVAAAVLVAFFAGFGLSHQGFGSTDGAPSGALTSPSLTSPSLSATSSPGPQPTGDDVVAIAIDCYRNRQLPGTGVPAVAAPDLRELGLHVMAASTGRLGPQDVTGYAYQNMATGLHVFVYLSSEPFTDMTPAPGATTATREIDTLTVVTDTTHPMLVIGDDGSLVTSVASTLA